MTTNLTMQVRDRFNLTKQALESLRHSQMSDVNITILDDRSLPQTTAFVQQWCVDNGAHYIRNDEPLGTGQLRNMVMEQSREHWGQGDYVAPHDNDVYFKRGWLERLIACYRATKHLGFRLMGAYGHPFHHPIDSVEARTLYGDFWVKEVQALATQSMFMTWETWDQYGPFCDTPIDKTCQSEDIAYTNKIRAAGLKLGVVTPHLIHATALKNTFGEPGPGWQLVQRDCPEGVICE